MDNHELEAVRNHIIVLESAIKAKDITEAIRLYDMLRVYVSSPAIDLQVKQFAYSAGMQLHKRITALHEESLKQAESRINEPTEHSYAKAYAIMIILVVLVLGAATYTQILSGKNAISVNQVGNKNPEINQPTQIIHNDTQTIPQVPKNDTQQNNAAESGATGKNGNNTYTGWRGGVSGEGSDDESSTPTTTDTTIPTINMTSPANNSIQNTTGDYIILQVNGTATDNAGVSYIQVKVNDETWQTATGTNNWNITLNLSTGKYNISAKAYDTSSNPSDTQTINITVSYIDLIPPTINITSPVNNSIINSTVDINTTASDNDGITSVLFIVDGTTIANYTTSPYSVHWDSGTVSDGKHNISAIAYDTSGNKATSTISITVNNTGTPDNTSPNIGLPTIYSGNYSGGYFKGTISLRSSISDFGSGLASGTCKVNINSTSWTNTGVTQDANYCYYDTYNPGASFNISFEVNDTANNTGTSITSNYSYDMTTPTTNISGTAPAGGTAYTYNTWTAQSTVGNALSCNDDSGVGCKINSTIYCIDNSNSCNPNTTYISRIDISTEGTNYLRYRSNDTLNNQESAKNATIKIDTINPTINIAYSPSNPNSTQNITFTATAYDINGISTIKIYINNTNTKNCTVSPCNYTTKQYANGTVLTYYATANDSANNINQTTTANLTINNPIVDTIPPTVNITTPLNNSLVNGTININATASDNIGVASVIFSIDGTMTANDTLSPYTTTWDTTAASNGQHNITTTAYDTSGNNATSTISITVNSTYNKYYVSSSNGSDSNDGLSPATAWKTFAKTSSVLSGNANPGDTILLKRGDSWDEEFSIKLVGTVSNPVIIDAYGTGAKPIIYGDCHTNSWQAVNANVSSLNISYANGLAVYENGSWLTEDSEVDYSSGLSANISALRSGHWFLYWLGSLQQVYVYPSTPGTSDLLVIRDENMHISSGSSYINISNINLTRSNHGIAVWSSNNINLKNDDGSYMLQYSYYYDHSNNSVIENCTSYMTRDSSIYMWYGQGFVIRNNDFGNIQSNILGTYNVMEASVVGLGRITSSLVERNYLHDAEQWSAFDWEMNDNVTVRYNYMYHASISTPYGDGVKVYGNIADLNWLGTPTDSGSGTGITTTDDTPNGTLIIYNNVLYRAHSAQEKVTANGKVKFRNNIFVQYNNNEPMTEVMPAAVANNSFDSDYNIFYVMDSSTPHFNWNGSSYTGLAAYQAASGQELHSIVANPGFISTNPSQASDYQLNSTSPAKDFGINLKTAGIIASDDPYLDYNGVSIPQGPAPDAGAYEYNSNDTSNITTENITSDNISSFLILDMPFNPNGTVIKDYSVYNNNGTNNGALWKSSSIDDAGIVLSMSFDNDNSTTIIDDSGIGNNGVKSSGVTLNNSDCITGSCYTFDGSGSIDAGNKSSLDVSSALTISTWIKSNSTDYMSIIMKGDNGYDAYSYVLSVRGSDGYTYFVLNGSGSADEVSGPNLFDGQWHNLVATYNGVNATVYVDGSKSYNYTLTGNITKTPYTLKIGSGFKGNMDNIKIYNRSLTQEEIQEKYYNVQIYSSPDYKFNGVSSYVNVRNSTSLNINNTPITVSAWIYWKSSTEAYNSILEKEVSGTGAGYSLSLRSDQKLAWKLCNNASCISIDGIGGTVSFNEWHHIVGVYDGENITTYIDSNLDHTSSASVSWGGNSAANLTIGGHSVFSSGRYFNGSITNVQIYNLSLTPLQIYHVYQNYIIAGQSPNSTWNNRTFYISSSSGNDSNNGLSPETAWKSLGKIYLQSLKSHIYAGDSFLLKRGDSWEGAITSYTPLKGRPDAPITIGTYGTGAKPIIYGDGRNLTWTQAPGYPEVYQAYVGKDSSIAFVYEGNNTRYGSVYWSNDPADFTSRGYWGPVYQNTDTVTIRTSDGAAPKNIRVFRSAAVNLVHANHTIVENLDIREVYSAVVFTTSDSVIARGIETNNTQDIAILFADATTNSIMENNYLVNAGDTTVYMTYYGKNNTIRNNTIDGVYHNISGIINGSGDGDFCGIGLHTGNGDTIEYNRIYRTPSGAVDFYYEDNSIIRYNYMDDNGGGIYPHGTNLTIYGNIIIGSGGNAFNTENLPIKIFHNTFIDGGITNGGSTGSIIFRNNLYYSSAQYPSYGISEIVNNVTDSDYNCFAYDSAYNGYYTITYNGTGYNSLAALQAAGSNTHSVFVDGKLNPDYTLSADSGCKDVGVDISGMINFPYKDYDGVSIPQGSAPDAGAYEYAGNETPEDFIVQPNATAIALVNSGNITAANALWWGFNENDTTDSLQAALNSNATNITIPNVGHPWNVRPLFIRSNKDITLGSGVVIQATKGAYLGIYDEMLTMSGVSNVTLRGYNATLKMQRDDYLNPPYNHSEFRAALVVFGSTNIQLYGFKVGDTGGDGIFIGSCDSDGMRDENDTIIDKVCGWGYYGLNYSDNVTIKDIVSDNNYRQGISVISAKNLLIENSTFQNTNGTAPQSGIDLEPDYDNEQLVNVTIKNCLFQNNTGLGIIISPHLYDSISTPMSITIQNTTSRNNGMCAFEYSGSDTDPGHYLGYIKIINDTFTGCTYYANTWDNVDIINPDDVTPPTVTITSPANTTLPSTNITLSFTASDDTFVSRCWYKLNNGANISLPNCNSITLAVPDGQDTITVFANDSKGNTGSATRSFSVNASGFISSCSDLSYANTIYKLSSNVSINGATCFNFTADNTTLDCKGHSITGNNITGAYGIYTTKYNINNMTIKNCVISNFSIGIYFYFAQNSMIDNTTVSTTKAYSFPDGGGILIYPYANYNTIKNSNVNAPSGYSIMFNVGSSYNNIINTTSTSGGIDILDSNYNMFNNITGLSTDDISIALQNSNNNTITNSRFNGYSNSDGALSISGGSQNNTIANSTINGLTGGRAITIKNINTTRNTFINNTILNATTLTYLDSNTAGNKFYWNNFTGTGYWVENYNETNMFNTTNSTGTRQGNYYQGITDYNISDSNSDGWGDSGTQYPVNSTKIPTKWIGLGSDYGPRVS